MPELPEVETMVLGLRSVMLGRAIEGIDIYEKKALNNTPPRLLVPLKGCLIIGLTRKGKFLFLHLSDGTQLLFHLKMTGRLVLRPRETPPERWERLSFTFRGWDQRLSFDDQRKFGYMAVHPGGCECPVPLVYELGPDALQVSLEVLRDTLAFSDRPVKSLLLDQRSIAGLGNIYVDECLYRAGIHPLTPSSRIPPVKVERLHGQYRRSSRRPSPAAALRSGTFAITGVMRAPTSDTIASMEKRGRTAPSAVQR